MFVTRTVVIPANAIVPVHVAGKYVYIRACSAVSVAMGFDHEPRNLVYPGAGMPWEKGFQELSFEDTLGAGAILIVQVADAPIRDIGLSPAALAQMNAALSAIVLLITAGNVDLAAIEVLLTSILGELQGSLTVVGWNRYATNAALATQVMAQRAARTMCQFQADPENADFLYIGFDNTVTAAKWALKLAPGQGDTLEVGRDAIWGFSPTINQYLGWMDF